MFWSSFGAIRSRCLAGTSACMRMRMGTLAGAEAAPTVRETFRSRHAPMESPLVSAFVNNLMRDGKKATARRIVWDALKHIASQRPGADAEQLMREAVERVEPLFKIVGVKRGAKSLQTPRALTERQRRRTAVMWILDASEKRFRREPAGIRIGKELLGILADDSVTITKRRDVHKAALQNRSNVVLNDRRIVKK